MKKIRDLIIIVFFLALYSNVQSQNYYLIQEAVSINQANSTGIVYELRNGNTIYAFEYGVQAPFNRFVNTNFSSNSEINSIELSMQNLDSQGGCNTSFSRNIPQDNTCNAYLGFVEDSFDSCLSYNINISFAKLGSFKTTLTSPTTDVNICERQTLDFFDQTTYCSQGKIPYGVEYSLNSTFTSPQVLLAFGEHDTRFTFLPSDITNDPSQSIYMRVRRSATPGDYLPGTAIYNLDGCSPVLEEITNTDVTCFNETDADVTLRFESDIDPGNQMRYYIYEGDPSSFTGDKLADEQPDIPGILAVDDPLLTLNTNLEGTYSGLGEGTYFIIYQELDYSSTPVTVKSGEITPSFTIEEPSEIIITAVNTTEPLCTGDKGRIVVEAVGGGYNNTNDDLEYLLSANGAAFDIREDGDFTGLDDGFYEIAVRNKANPSCDVIYPTTIIIDSPAELLFTSTSPGIASPDGQISAVYEGGTPGSGYSFVLTKTNGTIPPTATEVINTTNQTITYTGLDIGTYQIEITDANDCTANSGDIEVTAAPLPSLGAPTYTTISCSGNSDGGFSIPVSYGAANNIATTISYRLIDSGDNQINAGTVDIDTDPNTDHEINIAGLATGSYTLAIIALTGDFGNTDTVVTSDIIIDPVTPIAIDFSTSTITNVSCNGLSDGAIQLSVSGSTEYQYALTNFPAETDWVDLPVDNTIRNLAGITYSIILRNKNNTTCQSVVYSNAFEIIETEAIIITPTPTNVTTNGGSEGSISLDISGGTPGSLPNPEYTFNWSGTLDIDGSLYSNNTQNINNLLAGTYQVIVTDANTCTATLPQAVVISEPGPLSIQPLTGTDTCNGLDTGTIIANVQGTGDITFEFLRNPGPTEIIAYTITTPDRIVTAPDLATGIYGLRITEVFGGNTVTTPTADYFTINELTLITATVTPTDIACNEFNTGVISITDVLGGSNTGYEFAIDDGFGFQPGNTFSGLSPRAYLVTVRDNLGCEFTTTVNIVQAGAPVLNTMTTVVTNASSATNLDGSIVLEFETNPDPANFTYEWTGPGVNGQMTKDLEFIIAGNYQVVVTAPGNCSVTIPFTVGVQDTPSIDITNQQNPCFGETNGSITAAVAGTGPYNLQWSEAILGDLVGETGLTLENVGEGTYTLNVIDLGETPNTVGNSPNVVLIEPQAITAEIVTTPSCSANDTGTIVISNVQGGEPGAIQDYTYSIDGSNFQNDPLFENLNDATYQVWVQDGNNCDGIFSGITVAPSAAIEWDEPNTVVTDATAQGANDGTITLAFSSDDTNYIYEWNGPGTVDETTQNLTGKAAGVYTVIITNENGCTLERIFTIAEPGLLTITVNSTKNPCFGENNGNIQTTVVGAGNLSYQWSEAVLGDLIGETGPNLNNVPAGTYTLTVTDNAVIPANVVSSNAITLSDPAVALDAQAAPTDAQCAGVADGMVTITASGGIPPYEYSIDGGANYQPGATFTDLGLGTYSFRVRDSNDCVADAPATINEPPTITFSFVATPLSAAGASDGAIDIAASGGTGNLSFNWVGPAGFTPTTDEDISGLVAGDYTVTVSDENGCTFVSNPITIDEPGAIIITLTINEEILCNGDEFGEIIADVQGGVPNYTYQWFQEGNNTPLGETTNLISNLGAGNYFLRVTDANGVSRDSNILPITEPPALQVTLQNKVDIVCSGEASGSVNITVQGGTAPYQFQWSNGATSQNLVNIPAGDYFVEVFDDNGCLELLEITINAAPDALQIVDATISNVSEYLANDGSIALDITGGATPYTINWTRDSDNILAGNTPTITALSADSYTVSVSDANGCNVTETYEVTQPDIVEETIVQPTCQGETNGSISVLVNQGNGTFTYLWNTGETTNTITNLGAGDYSITITGFGDGPLTRTYTLEDPLPLEVDLGADRVLCADQILELDATVEDDTATYAWTSDNGFSSSNPEVTLTTTGNYTVTVQTASGCTAIGIIFVDISTDEIDAEFAMSSQVFTGEVLIAVDISFPLPETIEWVVPEGAAIVKQDSDEVELIFNQAGEYEIGIITRKGACIAQKTKKVLVVAKDAGINENEDRDLNKLVEDFILYPNPTTGQFTADISLTQLGNISIKVFNFANNALVASERGRGEASYSIPFDISGMPSGVYAVVLETPFGTSLQKIIVR